MISIQIQIQIQIKTICVIYIYIDHSTKQICRDIKTIYSVSIREAYLISNEVDEHSKRARNINDDDDYIMDNDDDDDVRMTAKQKKTTMSALIAEANYIFNEKTLERIIEDLAFGYLAPEFELWRLKFYQRICHEWSWDAAASFFNKLIIKGRGKDSKLTKTLKTTIGHNEDALGFCPSVFYILARGVEDHDKILYHVAIDIANSLKNAKFEYKNLHFFLNSDAATRKHPRNIGNMIFKNIRTILELAPLQHKYENIYGYVYDIRFFCITVKTIIICCLICF